MCFLTTELVIQLLLTLLLSNGLLVSFLKRCHSDQANCSEHVKLKSSLLQKAPLYATDKWTSNCF